MNSLKKNNTELKDNVQQVNRSFDSSITQQIIDDLDERQKFNSSMLLESDSNLSFLAKSAEKKLNNNADLFITSKNDDDFSLFKVILKFFMCFFGIK